MSHLVEFFLGGNVGEWPSCGLPPTDNPKVGDELKIRGVDYGKDPVVVWRTNDWVIVKFPGHHYWNGRWSPPGYARTEYILCRITLKGMHTLPLGGRGYHKWEEHARSEPGNKWRAAMQQMIKFWSKVTA